MAHALPFRNDFVRDHSVVLVASVLAHLVLLVLLGLSMDWWPRRDPQPVRLAIQASVVDARAVRQRVQQRELAERAAAEAAAERRREEQRRQQVKREAEKQRVAEQRRAEEQQRQQKAEAARRAEQQRRQEAEKAQRAKAELQRKEAAAREQRAEAQRKSEAEARRKAEGERRQAQTRADLERQLAEEEELLAAADSGLLDQYAEVIRQKVERNWIRPASARPGISCVVLVKQIPGGDVVEVRVTECNGDAAVVRSIEAAVLRSSPLPPPPDPKLFDRSLRFEFRPRD